MARAEGGPCLNCPRWRPCAPSSPIPALGKTVARTELAAFASLKTFEVPLSALHGLEVDGVERRGKFICMSVGGLWLVFHLARGGWLTWKDAMPLKPARPGRGPLAARVVFDDDTGFELTEYGTQKRLALYVVTDLDKVPGIVSLGPDPMAADFTPEVLAGILEAAGRSQLKGILRDQRTIAGIGNAYSDEILHAARLSPSSRPAGWTRRSAPPCTRRSAPNSPTRSGAPAGLAAKELKGDKKLNLRVHGKTGQPCPICGTTIAEVSFADSSLQYCPGCQTGGKLLADRRLSRLLK